MTKMDLSDAIVKTLESTHPEYTYRGFDEVSKLDGLSRFILIRIRNRNIPKSIDSIKYLLALTGDTAQLYAVGILKMYDRKPGLIQLNQDAKYYKLAIARKLPAEFVYKEPV